MGLGLGAGSGSSCSCTLGIAFMIMKIPTCGIRERPGEGVRSNQILHSMRMDCQRIE